MFDNHSFCLLVTDLGSRSRSPASSPDNKLMSPTRTTSEQKPFRGFDITSLIRKDDEAPAKTESAKDSGSLPGSPGPSGFAPAVSPPFLPWVTPVLSLFFGRGFFRPLTTGSGGTRSRSSAGAARRTSPRVGVASCAEKYCPR